MSVLNPLRSYRRYRYNNRYDSPLLILIIDSCLLVLKYACIVALFAIAWLAATSLHDRNIEQPVVASQSESSEQMIVPAVSETNTALLSQSELAENLTPDNNAAPKPKVETLDSSWVLKQNPDHFIVQYGSSPDLELMKQFAQEMDSTEPMAIYVFKRTPSGRPVYGIASTLHTDLDEALSFVKQLPTTARQFDPWVRPLKDLQNSIKRIENVRG